LTQSEAGSGAEGTGGAGPAGAAAFLGAAAIGRGRFSAWSCFLAVYFLVFGITGLQQLGAQSYVQEIFYGAALALAVTMARLSQLRRDARS
jgi:ribose transport system permease protein